MFLNVTAKIFGFKFLILKQRKFHPKSNFTNFILSFDDKLIQLDLHKYYIFEDFNLLNVPLIFER